MEICLTQSSRSQIIGKIEVFKFRLCMHWLDSNFIPMDSKKFEFWNFDYIIRFAIKNESEIEKLRSRDRRISEKNRFYEIKTLTHNSVNTISDKRNWTGSSDSACDLLLLTEVWWRHDYVIWRNYEKSIFWTWAILELLMKQVSTYTHISNQNLYANSMHKKIFESAYANF